MTPAFEAGFKDTIVKIAEDVSTNNVTPSSAVAIARALLPILGSAGAGAGIGALLSEKGKRGSGALKGALIAPLLTSAYGKYKGMQNDLHEKGLKIQELEDQLKPIVDERAKSQEALRQVINGR